MKKSILKEMIVALSIAMLAILSITAYFSVGYISKLTRENIYLELENEVESKALIFSRFFAERGKLVKTLFQSPDLLQWFENYKVKGSDIDDDPQHKRNTQYFIDIANSDDTIKATFFAPASTFEYFDLKGRYNDPAYATNKRPWWFEAIEQDTLFVSVPSLDIVDKTIVSSVKAVVRNKNGQFMGVGGIDFLLSTINEELLAQLKYQGEGEGLMIADNGAIVYFHPASKQFEEEQKLPSIDNLFDGADGFTELTNTMIKEGSGFTSVTWQGEKHIVRFSSIKMDEPKINWRVALMLSEEVINAPIRRDTWIAIFVVFALIVVILITIALLLYKLSSPLKTLVNAMEEIASGDGDLSKRILIDREDELGLLGSKFNEFVGNIHELISQSKESVEKLHSFSETVNDVTQKTTDNALNQKAQIELVATAATEMAYTVQNISENAVHASHAADLAESKANEGSEIVNISTESIEQLSDAVHKAAEVIKTLHEDSRSIGEVLEVIRSIADQTNLLALNAAIEAARAGEQGRGFAVVADEVRSLAARTQESTENIQGIIAGLQSSAENASDAMNEGLEKANIGVEKTRSVREVLSAIVAAISDIQTQSAQIACATQEQVVVAEDITQKTESIKTLSDITAEQAETALNDLRQQKEIADHLANLINRFKL